VKSNDLIGFSETEAGGLFDKHFSFGLQAAAAESALGCFA